MHVSDGATPLSLHTALNLSSNKGDAKLHALTSIWTVSRSAKPHVLGCGKAVATSDDYRVPRPIDLDQWHLLLVKPGQYVESDAAAAVQHDDARRQVRVASEKAIGLLLRRIVAEAVPNEERARFDPKRDAVSGEDQRVPRTVSPCPLVLRSPAVTSPMPIAVRPFAIVNPSDLHQ